ncbi:MAG: DUF4143 domain-containing protein [Candidatus Nanopelagicales bacterium]
MGSISTVIQTPCHHAQTPSWRPALAAALLSMSPERMLNDLEATGILFESLVAHDLRSYAEAARASCFHYREAEGRLEVDYILEAPDGDWTGVEVKLGETEIDKAAASLARLAGRVPRPPRSLVIVTGPRSPTPVRTEFTLHRLAASARDLDMTAPAAGITPGLAQ